MPGRSRGVAGILLLLVAGSLRMAWALDGSRAPEPGDVEVGRALYLQGRRADGTPLAARRSGGMVVTGEQAACAV